MTDEELLIRHAMRTAYGIATPLTEVKPKLIVVTFKPDEPQPPEEIQCAPPTVTLH
jgi:hypothetical protein